MAGDGGLNVLGKVRIDGSRRVFGKQCDALGDGAANWLGSMKNSDGTRVIFDDNFRAGAHPGPGGLCLSKRIFE